MSYYSYVVTVDEHTLEIFDDNRWPHLTPGGQRRMAIRYANELRKQHPDLKIEVIGYMGSLGSFVMELDNPEDMIDNLADYTSYEIISDEWLTKALIKFGDQELVDEWILDSKARIESRFKK